MNTYYAPARPVIVAAPMSFAGSSQRIWRLTRHSMAWMPLAVLLVALAWIVVAGWYVVVFGLFGLLTIPYRLIRRGQRRRNYRPAPTSWNHAGR